MAAISAANIITLADLMTAAMLAEQASAFETKSLAIVTQILDYEDADRSLNLLGGAESLKDEASYLAISESSFADLFVALKKDCVDADLDDVTDVDSFLEYYNIGDGGPWNALMAPAFRTLYNAVTGKELSATNAYPAAIASMATRSITDSVAGTFTAGTVVDPLLYAGAARATATVSGAAGTGTITVTATVRTATGTTVTGRVFTCANTNGAQTLVPAVTGDLILTVTGISFSAGITAAAVVVNGLIPSGRTNPPV